MEIACPPSLLQVVGCDLPDEVLHHPWLAQAAGFVWKSVEVSMRVDDECRICEEDRSSFLADIVACL
jgi:hypothetical protein